MTEHTSVRGLRGASEWAVAVAIALALVTMIATIAVMPVRGFDARMIWAFHSRLIFEAGAYPPPLLSDPAFVIGHPRYPSGIPLVNALAAIVTGSWSDRAALVIPALFYPAIVALLGTRLIERDDRWGWYVCGAFALMPMLTAEVHGGADSGYVDLVLAFYVLAAATLALGVRSGSLGTAAAAGLVAAAAATTKNEGLLLAVFLCAAAWLQPRARRRPAAPLLMTATTLALVAPWKLVQSGLAGEFEERYGAFLTIERLVWGLGRAGDVALDMFRVLFLTVPSTALAWWIVLGAWVVCGDKRDALQSRGLWIVPVYAAVVFVLYLITPWEGIDQVHTSFDRLSLQVLPVALWALAGSEPILHDRR